MSEQDPHDAYVALYGEPRAEPPQSLTRAYPPPRRRTPRRRREATVASAAPKAVRPALIVVCTNGGRHKRRELLRLTVMRDEDGRPVLSQSMSPQPGQDRQWTPVNLTVEAGDGHNVVSKVCPSCALHVKWRVDKLAEHVAAIEPGRTVEVDICSGIATQRRDALAERRFRS
jgi:hypothetical protein